MQSPLNSVKRVLGPVDLDTFFEDYWEIQPLHIERSDPEHFEPWLSLKLIEALLTERVVHYPSVQLTSSKRTFSVEDYVDDAGQIVALRLLEGFRDGATIVLSQAHELFPSLSLLRRDFQQTVQLACQTNVYLSPPKQQGFNPHYDSHDVFILQVSGSKQFNFYEGGVRLPYRHDDFKAGQHDIGPLSHSILLHAGDTLYIPRGVVHDAQAQADRSLHITLGVHAITWRDLALQVIERQLLEDPQYRSSVPRSLWIQPANAMWQRAEGAAPDSMRALLGTASADDLVTQALDELWESFATESAADCTGALTGTSEMQRWLDDNRQPQHEAEASALPFNGAEVANHASERPALHIRLKTLSLFGVDDSHESLRLRLAGQTLVFRGPARTVMQQLIRNEGGMWLADLDIDSTELQRLCHILVNANLLQVSSEA